MEFSLQPVLSRHKVRLIVLLIVCLISHLFDSVGKPSKIAQMGASVVGLAEETDIEALRAEVEKKRPKNKKKIVLT